MSQISADQDLTDKYGIIINYPMNLYYRIHGMELIVIPSYHVGDILFQKISA